MEETKKTSQPKAEKMSYEELEALARRLSSQNESMYQQLRQMNIANIVQELEMLFKVVQFRDAFSSDFVIRCVEEIENVMSPEEADDKKSSEEGK